MITIELTETLTGWDEEKEEFFDVEPVTLEFEHSLESLSKWEQKWHLPFLHTEDKTVEQTYSYIECMCLTPVKDNRIFYLLPEDEIRKINNYISDPKTATTITDHTQSKPGGHKKEIVTSEVIYCSMAMASIPFECDKWPLERLLMLIQVYNIKNSPDKKMSKGETAAMYRNLNKQRRPKKKR